MSEIKKGDLVMVVRPSPCCGADNLLGYVYTVSNLTQETRPCNYCGAVFTERLAWDGVLGAESIGRLKRLDPNALKDDVLVGEGVMI